MSKNENSAGLQSMATSMSGSGTTRKRKKAVISQLEKTPIIQLACEKVGIGRATYYRWTKEDPLFCERATEALDDGVARMNELAESKLLLAIQEGHMTGIIFWLKNRHKAYRTRVEMSAKVHDPQLDENQKEAVRKSLILGGLIAQDHEKDEGDP